MVPNAAEDPKRNFARTGIPTMTGPTTHRFKLATISTSARSAGSFHSYLKPSVIECRTPARPPASPAPTSGFEEVAEDEAQARARTLREVLEPTGLALSGPNCLGNMAAPFNLMSMTDNRPTTFRPGPVAIIGQSGGLTMGIKRRLEERGLDAGYLISTGNETGLKTADYIRFFADAPDVRVVVSYLESVRNPPAFLESCRYARSRGTAVIVVKLGATEAGRAAAMAHTGALAGAIEAFDTIAGAAGAIRVDNLDDVVEVTDYLLHLPPPAGPRVGAITFSGGLRGLLLDGAARAGVRSRASRRASAKKRKEWPSCACTASATL